MHNIFNVTTVCLYRISFNLEFHSKYFQCALQCINIGLTYVVILFSQNSKNRNLKISAKEKMLLMFNLTNECQCIKSKSILKWKIFSSRFGISQWILIFRIIQMCMRESLPMLWVKRLRVVINDANIWWILEFLAGPRAIRMNNVLLRAQIASNSKINKRKCQTLKIK